MGQSSPPPSDLWHRSDRAESAPPPRPGMLVKAEEGGKLLIDSC